MTDVTREGSAQAHLLIQGDVQGVYFRQTMKTCAERLAVQGWVRNLADGSVEALLQGPRSSVDQVIQWANQGPPRARVAHLDVHWELCTERRDTFQVIG